MEDFDLNRLYVYISIYSLLYQCARRPFQRLPVLISSTGKPSELSISAKQNFGWTVQPIRLLSVVLSVVRVMDVKYFILVFVYILCSKKKERKA